MLGNFTRCRYFLILSDSKISNAERTGYVMKKCANFEKNTFHVITNKNLTNNIKGISKNNS